MEFNCILVSVRRDSLIPSISETFTSQLSKFREGGMSWYMSIVPYMYTEILSLEIGERLRKKIWVPLLVRQGQIPAQPK